MNDPFQPNRQHQDIRILCTHVMPTALSGPAHLCGSPALLGESFCYYHHPVRQVVPNRNEARARHRARRIARQSFTVPLPTNRPELLHSLNEVIALIAANQVDLRRAGLLIHALQVVGKNLVE